MRLLAWKMRSYRQAASTSVSPWSQRPPGSAHWPPCARKPLARRVSRKPVIPDPSWVSRSVMATADRFRLPAVSLATRRGNAAQRSATRRRKASLNASIVRSGGRTLEKLDGNALGPAQESDANARPYVGRLHRELGALGLELGDDL